MEAAILVGVQGAGKTTFYRERLSTTHAHISLDELGTRERERIAISECIAKRQPFAVDNTNTTAARRATYVSVAKAAGYRLVAYFFQTELRDAIRRNHRRKPNQVPVPALIATFKRLEAPAPEEGFDEIRVVRLTPEDRFSVTEGVVKRQVQK